MAHFINPLKEAVMDFSNDLLNYITKTFPEARELEEEDKKQQLPQPVTTTAAL